MNVRVLRCIACGRQYIMRTRPDTAYTCPCRPSRGLSTLLDETTVQVGRYWLTIDLSCTEMIR